MYYNSKASIGRLSEFARSAKDVLLGSNQSAIPHLNIPVLGEQKAKGKLPAKSQPTAKTEETFTTPVTPIANQETDFITQTNLEQAIIWSEILGKPLSKRRERRYYGN